MIINLNINAFIEGAIEVSVLLGLVLLLRKPVAKLFGSNAAYTLWLLPALGLLLPRIDIGQGTMNLPVEIVTSYTNIADKAVIMPLAVSVADAPLRMPFYLFYGWIIIGLLWLGFQLFSYRHYYQQSKLCSRDSEGELRELAKGVASEIGLRKVPKMRICVNGGEPSVMGLLRPMIVLPQDFVDGYSRAEQRLVLAHEMMHIKRRDLWAGFGALLFRAFNWPNPLVHIAAHYFRADQEAACDSSVLKIMNGTQTRTDYMKTVVKTAKPCTGV